MAKVCITNIFWKRTTLFVEYTAKSFVSLCLSNLKGQKTEMQCKQVSDNLYRAKLNITIANGRENLLGGKYSFIADNQTAGVEATVLQNVESFARVYLYSNENYAYIITFAVDASSETDVYLTLSASYMMKNKKPKRRRPFLEGKSVVNKFGKLINLTGRRLCGFYYSFCSLFKSPKKNHILFMSENRFEISENLVAIDQRLKERDLYQKYIISYSFRNIFDKKYSPFSWLMLIAKIAKSDYVFIDDYAPILALFKLKRSTKLVQTWHAGFGFKLVGYGRFGTSGSPHPYISCHRTYSYGLVGCEALKEIYSEVWGIPEQNLIASGMPRLDHFLDEEHIKTKKELVFNTYPTLRTKKIILFAPTYRGLDQTSAYYDFKKINFDLFYDYASKNNAVILFKMHHFIKEAVPIPNEYTDKMIEVENLNINDLFYVTDVLITDYSSCFYDYALLKKPMIFYAYDKELYAATRGVHRNLEKVAPGKICKNFKEVISCLENEDFEIEKLEGFFTDKNADKEKLASDIVIDQIILNT